MLLQLVLRSAEGFAPAPDGDAALVRRFAANQDESAFATLLQRHGPMVWSVCRHLLADEADAEDAFQATFLALVRSAKSVRKAEAVGAWLHGAAVRIATKAKRSAARRRQREQSAAEPEADRPIPEAAWNELLAAVHEEVQNLPEQLRTAFVLCELEGVRQPDAAVRLGWKPGTLTGRLTRARQALVQRLAGRGLAPAMAGGGLALGLATACAAVPVPMIDTAMTLIRAGGTVPPAVLNLMKEASPMLSLRSKLAAAALVFAGGLGAVFFPMASAQPLPGTPGGGFGAPPAGGGGPGGAPPGLGGGTAPPRTDSAYGPPASPAAKTQFEYKFVEPPQELGAGAGLPAFIKQFEDLGNAGWEYCGPLPIGKNGSQLVFKRQKPMAARGGGIGAPGFGAPGMPPGAGAFPGGGGFAPGAAPAGGGLGPQPGAGNNLPPRGAGGNPVGGGVLAPPAAAGNNPLTLVVLRNAAAVDLGTTLERLFQNKLTVVAEPRTNSLILSGDKKFVDEAKGLIEKLDVGVPPPPKP